MNRKIQEINEAIKELKKEKLRLRKTVTWKCPLCNKNTRIGNLDLVIMQFYVHPHGCTGGDYWTSGDRPEYKIHCVKCNQSVREIDCDGNGVGYGRLASFSIKRWRLIHNNVDVFKSKSYEARK